MRSLFCLILAAGTACAQEKYTGPKPPKQDVLYLVHADNLVPTEALDLGRGESKHNETVFTIPGGASSARTPLAEPIFIIDANHIQPQGLELYRAEVKGNRREFTAVQRRTRGGAKPLRLSVQRLGGSLYRVEVDETIDNGEYVISPNGSNTVFCFEVY